MSNQTTFTGLLLEAATRASGRFWTGFGYDVGGMETCVDDFWIFRTTRVVKVGSCRQNLCKSRV